jgi:hypothetical protein
MKLKGFSLGPVGPEEEESAEDYPQANDQRGVFVGVLIFIGVICLVAGGLYLTKITAGVGGIAAACFFGIIARIYQAHIHHNDR